MAMRIAALGPTGAVRHRRIVSGVRALAIAVFVAAAPVGATADLDAGIRAYDAGYFERAYAEFAPLAEAGSAEAQVRLAGLLQRGEGTAPDPAAAVAWLEKAADQDHPWALVALGDAYEDGRGVEKDVEQGIHLWLEAARQEFPPAMYRLSRIAVWFLDIDSEFFIEDLLAEHARNPSSQGKSMATLREEVQGYILDNKAKATMWLILAAELGDPRAERDLPGIAKRLTAAEKAEAEQRAALWRRTF